MSNSKFLVQPQKEEFDVNNPKHQAVVIKYLDEGKWDISITVKGSYNVPYSCMEKMARYAFNAISSK